MSTTEEQLKNIERVQGEILELLKTINDRLTPKQKSVEPAMLERFAFPDNKEFWTIQEIAKHTGSGREYVRNKVTEMVERGEIEVGWKMGTDCLGRKLRKRAYKFK